MIFEDHDLAELIGREPGRGTDRIRRNNVVDRSYLGLRGLDRTWTIIGLASEKVETDGKEERTT
ncbi:MAG: hypothetical protein GEU90_09780 [Gemmatimonas sp.]|nr:hypothetical protein [Gemmatimonas sp.]